MVQYQRVLTYWEQTYNIQTQTNIEIQIQTQRNSPLTCLRFDHQLPFWVRLLLCFLRCHYDGEMKCPTIVEVPYVSVTRTIYLSSGLLFVFVFVLKVGIDYSCVVWSGVEWSGVEISKERVDELPWRSRCLNIVFAVVVFGGSYKTNANI